MAGDGGGIRFAGSSSANLRRTFIFHNTAYHGRGGGVAVDSASSADISVSNLRNNSAELKSREVILGSELSGMKMHYLLPLNTFQLTPISVCAQHQAFLRSLSHLFLMVVSFTRSILSRISAWARPGLLEMLWGYLVSVGAGFFFCRRGAGCGGVGRKREREREIVTETHCRLRE